MKLLSVARSLTAEVSCEGFYREGGAKNLLAKMIMHLLADPPLLAVLPAGTGSPLASAAEWETARETQVHNFLPAVR